MVLVKRLIGKGITNNDGECSVIYNSEGTGDVDIQVECMGVSETYELEDCLEIVNTSNPNLVVSQWYSTPIQITGKTKKNGAWGGTRIYGNLSTHRYVFLSQNSSNSHESEKIWYVLDSSLIDFKIEIGNGTVSLYINGTLNKSVSTDTSEDVQLSGGSGANPVTLQDVKIKPL